MNYHAFMAPITSLCILIIMVLGVSSYQKGVQGLNQGKPITPFKVHFSSWSVFKFNLRLSHTHTFSPHAALASSEQ